jgi:uncharacterized membrane protein YfcA
VWLRIIGGLAVAYTIAVAIDGGYALKRWLFGLFLVLVGVATMLASRRPRSEIERRQRRARASESALDMLWAYLPAGAARRTQTAAGVLLIAAGVLLGASSIPAL